MPHDKWRGTWNLSTLNSPCNSKQSFPLEHKLWISCLLNFLNNFYYRDWASGLKYKDIQVHKVFLDGAYPSRDRLGVHLYIIQVKYTIENYIFYFLRQLLCSLQFWHDLNKSRIDIKSKTLNFLAF